MKIEKFLKVFLESLRLSISRRISLAISFTIFLIVKLLFDFVQNKNFLDWLTILLGLLIFVMLATAVADIYDKHQINIKNQEKLKEKETQQKIKHDKAVCAERLKEAKYRKYITDLLGSKLKMVKKLYNNEHGRDFLPDLDVNTTDLVLHEVIVSTKQYTHFIHPNGRLDERKEISHLYVLTPRAKEIMDKNKEKFKSA
ncbi:hypothetical protein [Lactobacillus johnsonii]|uniref:Uncharacterized protein n=1 Tax=Lactobacillus johnsonii TaxID=33959 RepID=A0A9X0J6E2_LACJH|nr:hypothetical protein [Lactobacillus johnsonii]KXN75972.1 hypothetical protein AYJ53_08075 [Lactobacillus johnsonii]